MEFWDSWIIYGRGICTDTLDTEATVEKIEALLQSAPRYREEVYQAFSKRGIEKPSIEDFLEYDSQALGVAFHLAKVIAEAEHIRFYAFSNDGNEDCLLVFPKQYPWHLNETEKNITEEQIDDILRKYVSPMCSEGVEIKYISAYGGDIRCFAHIC